MGPWITGWVPASHLWAPIIQEDEGTDLLADDNTRPKSPDNLLMEESQKIQTSSAAPSPEAKHFWTESTEREGGYPPTGTSHGKKATENTGASIAFAQGSITPQQHDGKQSPRAGLILEPSKEPQGQAQTTIKIKVGT